MKQYYPDKSDYNLGQKKHTVWVLFSLNKVNHERSLGILTGETHPQIKRKRLQKVWMGIFWYLGHSINYLGEVLMLKSFFQKSNVDTTKTPIGVVIDAYFTCIHVNIGSERSLLY